MGQTFSRRVVRGLERGMDKYRTQVQEEALQDIAAKQRLAHKKGITFTDPNALQTGFTRGQGPWILPNEVAQEAFLRDKQEREGGEKVELEPDLLKFLEDMGPLQKVVDTEFTSPRLVDYWKHEGQDQLQHKHEATFEKDDKTTTTISSEQHQQPHDALMDGRTPTHAMSTSTASASISKRIPPSERRTLQQMPLMEDSNVMITRSTNFSTTIYKEDVSLGVTDLDLYSLLRKQEEQQQQQLQQSNPSNKRQQHPLLRNSNTKPNPATVFAASAAAKAANINSNASLLVQRSELVSDFAKQFHERHDVSDESSMDDDAQDAKRQELLVQTLQVLELPALMKDADGYYFGVWRDRVDDLQITSQLQPVAEYKIKLVLADITDTERQYQLEEAQLQAPRQFSASRQRRERRSQSDDE